MADTTIQNYSATYKGKTLDAENKVYRALPNGLAVAQFSEGCTPVHINSNTTGSGLGIKTGAGTIVSVMINTKGSTSNSLTLYDGTSTGGTVLAVLDTTASLTFLPYNMSVTTGIWYTLLSGTAADLTIMYL